MLKTWILVVLRNPAWIAAGLRAGLSLCPAPVELALLDLSVWASSLRFGRDNALPGNRPIENRGFCPTDKSRTAHVGLRAWPETQRSRRGA